MPIKKAIILAAGFGKRLLPLTKEHPKPLLEIGGKKLIEYSIDLLRENNITEIIINSHYLHEKISEFINKKYPNISLSYEKNILDTGGGILNAMSFFKQDKSGNDYIYTGCQVLNPNILNLKKEGDIFSMNEIWNDLIAQESLNGCLSSCSFLHATNLEIYNQLIKIKTID